MLQLADLLLIITADLFLLGHGNGVDHGLADVGLLGNANLAVDKAGSVVALGILGALAIVLWLLNSAVASTSSSTGSGVGTVSVVVVVAFELGGGAAGLVVQGLIGVGADRVADLDALEVVSVRAVGLVNGVANSL